MCNKHLYNSISRPPTLLVILIEITVKNYEYSQRTCIKVHFKKARHENKMKNSLLPTNESQIRKQKTKYKNLNITNEW